MQAVNRPSGAKPRKPKKHLARFFHAVQSGKLSQQAVLVGTVLAAHANQVTGETFPSWRRICALARIGRGSLSKGLRELREAGIIDMGKALAENQPGKLKNVYCMLGDEDASKVPYGSCKGSIWSMGDDLYGTVTNTGEFTHGNSVPSGPNEPPETEGEQPY